MSASINNQENIDIDNNNHTSTSEPLCAKRDKVPLIKTSQKHSTTEPQIPNPSKEDQPKEPAGFFEGIYNTVVSYLPNFTIFSPARSDNKVYSSADEIVAEVDSKEQRQELFDQIKGYKVSLNHVTPDEKIFDINARKKILKQITESPPALAPVETNDKSVPVIPEQVNLNKVDHKPLLTEIELPHSLRHVDEVSDRSTPAIPSENINLHKVDHKKLLEEIEASAK